MKNGLWVWATVAAIGLGTTAAAARGSLDSPKAPQKPAQKRSHVSHAATPAVKHSATPSKGVAKKTAKPQAKKSTAKSAVKPMAKKPAAKHSAQAKKAPAGRLAKRHA